MRLRDMNPGEALAAAAAMTLRLGGFSKAAELMGELLMDTWTRRISQAHGIYAVLPRQEGHRGPVAGSAFIRNNTDGTPFCPICCQGHTG